MPRKIYIIRHAKAADYSLYATDYERPLAERGKRDAPMMGKRLKALNIIPDLIISSTAPRAAQTAILIGEQVNYEKERIEWRKDLYHSSAMHIESVLREFLMETDADTIFLVAHNFGITDYANEKILNFQIDNIPTCGIVGYEIEMKDWHLFDLEKKGKYIYYDFPKNI